MTSAETFRRMSRLTAQDRMVLECRYDGEIPKDAVLAVLGNYTDQDEIAELREQAARKFDSAKKWLRRGHAESATYRMSGNNHAARIIRERYRNEARDMLEARSVIVAKMRAIESAMVQER